MAHDYAKKKKAPTKKKKPANKGLPAWFWLFTGIATGLFIAFLIYLSNVAISKDPNERSELENEANELSKQIKEQADRMREGQEALRKPTFEFYQRLPEMKIETPKPSQTAKPRTDGDKNYVLQVGSFRSFQDADALKAQLIMQGLDVQINKAKDDKGSDWHRVHVGPYTTEHSLNKAKDILADNDIPSMVLTIK